jgi:hypothetical protein
MAVNSQSRLATRNKKLEKCVDYSPLQWIFSRTVLIDGCVNSYCMCICNSTVLSEVYIL